VRRFPAAMRSLILRVMNEASTPPEGPPPLAGYSSFSPEPFEEPTRPKSSFGLIAIGILNILFGLVCGCTTGLGALTITGLSEADPEHVFSANFNEAVESAIEEQIEQANTDEERRALREAQDFMTSSEFQKVMGNVLIAVVESPAVSSLETLAYASLVAQIAFLISGVLLLMRVSVARPFSIVVALVTLALTVASVLYLNQVTDEIQNSMSAQLEEGVLDEKTDPSVREALEGMTEALGQPLKAAWTVTGAISALYPFIVVLVLLFSRNIQEVLSGSVDPGITPETF